MRTVEIDDRAYEIAESLARARNVAPGQVMSEILVAAKEDSFPRVEEENGFPIIRLRKRYPVTSEDVRRILSESE